MSALPPMPEAIRDLRVRPAAEHDVPELARLIGELGYPVSPAVLAERFARFSEAGDTTLVAEGGNGRLLGMATLHVTPVLHRTGPVGRLTSMVVDASARGRGVGRTIVEAAEAILRARGCVFLEVTSNARRADAHAFYERLGYERTSLRFGKSLDLPG